MSAQEKSVWQTTAQVLVTVGDQADGTRGVLEVRLLPYQQDPSWIEGDEDEDNEDLEVIMGTWAPLLNLPADVVWEG